MPCVGGRHLAASRRGLIGLRRADVGGTGLAVGGVEGAGGVAVRLAVGAVVVKELQGGAAVGCCCCR